MIHQLGYSNALTTPRPQTDWRWALVLVEAPVLAAGLVAAMRIELDSRVWLIDWALTSLFMMGVLAIPVLGAHCLAIRITRHWDRRRQTRILLGLPLLVAAILVAFASVRNTDRQRFRRYVTAPVPPSVKIEQVSGSRTWFEVGSWDLIFQINRADLDQLVATEQLLRQDWDRPDRAALFRLLDKPSRIGPSLESYQGFDGMRTRYLVYDPDHQRAFYQHSRF